MPRHHHHHHHHTGASSPTFPSAPQVTGDDEGAGAATHMPLLVLKVGTSTIIDPADARADVPGGFSLSNLGRLVDAVCHIKAKGYQVILVSSGAVGAGCMHLRLCTRPSNVQGKQAASAVGQCRMMRLYDDLFALRDMKVGQLILTRTDLLDRERFVNFKNTLKELLKWDVLPIINENDSLATAQFRFGDNDTLAAYVAVSLEAEWLFLLTDVDCLYTSNPRTNPNAKPISYVGLLDEAFALLRNDAGNNSGTAWGSGGMHTKIVAAKLACATGIPTALCNGQYPERVLDIIAYVKQKKVPALENDPQAQFKHVHRSNTSSNLYAASGSDGERDLGTSSAATTAPSSAEAPGEDAVVSTTADSTAEDGLGDKQYSSCITAASLGEMPYLGTIFAAKERAQKLHDRRRWVLSLPIHGRIYVDRGAAEAIVNGKKSLFAAGIRHVVGNFSAGEAVSLCFVDEQLQPPPSAENCVSGTPSYTEFEDDSDITEFARCVVRFGSDDIRKVLGKQSGQFKGILGSDCAEEEVAHRNTMVFVNPCVVFGCKHSSADRPCDSHPRASHKSRGKVH